MKASSSMEMGDLDMALPAEFDLKMPAPAAASTNALKAPSAPVAQAPQAPVMPVLPAVPSIPTNAGFAAQKDSFDMNSVLSSFNPQLPVPPPQNSLLATLSNTQSAEVASATQNAEKSMAQKQSTYTAVKRMVDQMISQIRTATMDEDKHKNWCEAEIQKNQAQFSSKNAKLRRVNTKVDNEKELVSEIEANLSILSQQDTSMKEEYAKYAQIATTMHNNFVTRNQNHDVSLQILNQAVLILQRFSAVNAEQQIASQRNTGFLSNSFLQAQTSQQFSNIAKSAVEELAKLQNLYQELKSVASKTDREAVLNTGLLQKISTNFLTELNTAKSYRANLRLQQLSELDTDNEDANTLKAQVQSVDGYVQRLKHACSDILQHYDERKARREQNLKTLEEAKNIISIDNADDIHNQLANLASSTDEAASRLVGSSAMSSGLLSRNSGLLMSTGMNLNVNANSSMNMNMNSMPVAQKPVSKSVQANMLGDLQSLQNFSSAQDAGENGLNMLAA